MDICIPQSLASGLKGIDTWNRFSTIWVVSWKCFSQASSSFVHWFAFGISSLSQNFFESEVSFMQSEVVRLNDSWLGWLPDAIHPKMELRKKFTELLQELNQLVSSHWNEDMLALSVFICRQPVVLKDLFGNCWVKFGRMKAWTSNGFPVLDFNFNWTFPELYVLWTLPIPLTVSDCFWCFNFIRCNASSDMRLIWEPLYRRARQLMILLESSSIKTIAVGKVPILDGSNACPETSVLVLSMRVPFHCEAGNCVYHCKLCKCFWIYNPL